MPRKLHNFIHGAIYRSKSGLPNASASAPRFNCYIPARADIPPDAYVADCWVCDRFGRSDPGPQCFTRSGSKRGPGPHLQHPKPGATAVAPLMVMNISQLADQVRGTPLRDVLTHYGFDVKREGTTLRTKTEWHNIVVTGGRWFDNKANVGGGGAIDLVMHIAGVDFSVACRSLADEFRPLAAGQVSLSFPSSSGCQTAPEKKSFEELIAFYAVRDDSNWPIARGYLSETRRIDPAIVDEMHAVGSIYSNAHRPNPDRPCHMS
jgi:hypothetical protein